MPRSSWWVNRSSCPLNDFLQQKYALAYQKKKKEEEEGEKEEEKGEKRRRRRGRRRKRRRTRRRRGRENESVVRRERYERFYDENLTRFSS